MKGKSQNHSYVGIKIEKVEKPQQPELRVNNLKSFIFLELTLENSFFEKFI